MKRFLIGIVALFLTPVLAGADAAERRLRDLSVPFYYDLGPDSIDVSKYPERRGEQYKIFVRRCSACHTLARSINSTMRSREEWSYYVHRMRIMDLSEKEHHLRRVELKDVVDFLVYDSRIRKIKRGKEFVENDQRLRDKFHALHEERVRLLRQIIERGSPASQGK